MQPLIQEVKAYKLKDEVATSANKNQLEQIQLLLLANIETSWQNWQDANLSNDTKVSISSVINVDNSSKIGNSEDSFTSASVTVGQDIVLKDSNSDEQKYTYVKTDKGKVFYKGDDGNLYILQKRGPLYALVNYTI